MRSSPECASGGQGQRPSATAARHPIPRREKVTGSAAQPCTRLTAPRAMGRAAAEARRPAPSSTGRSSPWSATSRCEPWSSWAVRIWARPTSAATCRDAPCRRTKSRTWWPGCRRSGRKSRGSHIRPPPGPGMKEGDNELDRTTDQTGDLHHLRNDPQCRRHARHRYSRPALSLLPEDPRAAARIRLLGPARSGVQLPDRRDALCDLSQPGRGALRRRDREGLLLGAQRRRPAVPDLRDQLRAPRLPRALVPPVQPLHVPLPRRRVLCRRFPRVRASGARALRVPLQDRRRHALHRGRADAHAGQPAGDPPGAEIDMRLTDRIGRWFDQRVPIRSAANLSIFHHVPRRTASWFYVFGSAATVVLALQVVTGILLAFIYVPSAGEAWNSLHTLNQHVSAGWFIRALHGWGSNFMVAIVLIHMVQVFLFGAFKDPRELTWIAGVLLLLLTLGMAFTGQVLRFDQDAYWGLGIGASIASRVPVVGPPIVHLLLGGPIIAGATLSRFFALHVFVIPGSLIAFVGLHLLLVLALGINEWPMPGRVVRRATYLEEYHRLTHGADGIPFVPAAVWKDIFFSGFILLSIVACAAILGPFGPGGAPDPTIIQTAPRPDFFFLWLYAVLSLLPPSLETPALLIGPAIVLVVLLALPFVSGEGEKSWRRRPIAVLTILLLAVALRRFTRLSVHSPWSPPTEALSGPPVPSAQLNA